jgi:uncharacterized protein
VRHPLPIIEICNQMLRVAVAGRSRHSVRAAQLQQNGAPGVTRPAEKRFAAGALLLLLGVRLFAAEVIPPAPAKYFNDYAGVTAADTAARLNQTLENFEKETSSQIVVAVFPKLQTDSSIEDYIVRVARAWQVGQQDVNNGAVLFVFIQDRKMYIQVGYGLEGVLPDALCKRIIEDEIKPHFKAGDYDRGLTAGVTAMLAAARGEYQGSGRTGAQGRRPGYTVPSHVFFTLIAIFFIISFLSRTKRRRGPGRGWIITGGGRGRRRGGGFSGGGGRFGGGGSGGSW